MSDRKSFTTRVDGPKDYALQAIKDLTTPEADKLAVDLLKLARSAGLHEFTELSKNFEQDRASCFNSVVKATRDEFFIAYQKLAAHLGKEEREKQGSVDEPTHSDALVGNALAAGYIAMATRISQQRKEKTIFTVHDNVSTRLMLDALLEEAKYKVDAGNFIDAIDEKCDFAVRELVRKASQPPIGLN